jgi:RNA-directed DNA polymerase
LIARVAAPTNAMEARHRSSRSMAGIERQVGIPGGGQHLTGWANYFRHGVSKAVFNAIDHYTWNRLVLHSQIFVSLDRVPR